MDEHAKKPSPIKRLRGFIDRHRFVTILITSLIVIGVAINIALLLVGPTPAKIIPVHHTPKAKPKQVYYSPLTGLPVANESDRSKPVTGIMIENSPDARPQSGIKQAEIVYEAIAEGGITRFLAIYQQDKPQLIGPVRSIRPYYLDWLQPYNASIAHVGGSALALQQVRNGTWRDIDQFFNGNSYWRASDRYAPHNVYTSFAKLDALNQAKGYATSTPKEMLRGDAKPAATPTASSISVHISGSTYDSSYTYNATDNTYTRSQGGAVMTDREDGAITPKVIIVMTVQQQEIWEETWRESMQTTGEGKAVIFQNGTATEVTWHKATPSDQLSFTDASGQQVELARGQTWITAIPPDRSVTWQP